MSEQRMISTMLALAAIVSAIIAVLVYVNGREHRKLQRDVVAIDKEIKKIQLDNLIYESRA